VTQQGDYYDRYWSAAGFNPVVELWPELRQLYAAYSVPGIWLDLGCGDGRVTAAWASEHATQYVGVDVAHPALAVLRDRGSESVRISDASTLPFADNTFSVVSCIEVLEHLFDPLGALREARRVLKPGGVVIATTPNLGFWRQRFDIALLGRWNPRGDTLSAKEPWRDPHIRFFTIRSLRSIALHADLEPIVVGAHAGSFFRHLPYLGARIRASFPESRPRFNTFPGLFGYRLHLVARRSDDS
jgi:ubiquinone/menaquinone biosynthesis C-methylase UbiE